MRNLHSLHHLVEMSPSEAVVPGKTQRPGPVLTNNKMVTHKNKRWKIKTIKTRKQLSKSAQDYQLGLGLVWTGDAFLYISQHFSIFLSIYLYFTAFFCIYLSFKFYILGLFDGEYRRPMDAIFQCEKGPK